MSDCEDNLDFILWNPELLEKILQLKWENCFIIIIVRVTIDVWHNMTVLHVTLHVARHICMFSFNQSLVTILLYASTIWFFMVIHQSRISSSLASTWMKETFASKKGFRLQWNFFAEWRIYKPLLRPINVHLLARYKEGYVTGAV